MPNARPNATRAQHPPPRSTTVPSPRQAEVWLKRCRRAPRCHSTHRVPRPVGCGCCTRTRRLVKRGHHCRSRQSRSCSKGKRHTLPLSTASSPSLQSVGSLGRLQQRQEASSEGGQPTHSVSCVAPAMRVHVRKQRSDADLRHASRIHLAKIRQSQRIRGRWNDWQRHWQAAGRGASG